MKERRNLYRTLYAQPDAPLAVIKANYHVLIERLKGHPDQDFADLQVGLLNTAYTVLKDPLKRTAYDRRLQERHPIHMLSLGPFASGMIQNPAGSGAASVNRRNYYRVLQIQPDASADIITASYNALKEHPYQDAGLMDEAFMVLSNPVTRMRYDAFLEGGWQSSERNLVPVNADQSTGDESSVNQTAVILGQATSYCIFCHAAYTKQSSPYPDSDKCFVCESPLPCANDELYKQKRRTNIRIDAQGELDFYLYWPDIPTKGILQDLSPRGARFLSEVSLDVYDIIKIVAPSFRAIAEAVHIKNEQSKVSVGVRFLTIAFERERGNFLSVDV